MTISGEIGQARKLIKTLRRNAEWYRSVKEIDKAESAENEARWWERRIEIWKEIGAKYGNVAAT